jgi:hypothetical protein
MRFTVGCSTCGSANVRVRGATGSGSCGRTRRAGIAGCGAIGPKFFSTIGLMSAASTSPAITRIALFGA